MIKKKILIFSPSWLGDAVISNSLLQILKSNFRNAKIDVLSPKWLVPIYERMEEVSEIVQNPFEHGEFSLLKKIAFAKKLRAKKYDLSIVLPNSFKSALILKLANIPKRVGYIGEFRYILLNSFKKLNKKKYPRMVDRFNNLSEIINHKTPNPKLKVDENNIKYVLKKNSIFLKKRKNIIFCPGATYGNAKKWPVEYFKILAKKLIEENYFILIVGTQEDFCTGKKITSEGTNIKNLCGKTSLGEVVDLLSSANLVISNDSGLMHVAAALQINLISIFGSSSPEFTPPLSKNSSIVKKNIKCSPCFKRECPLKHLKCLRDIKPDEIYKKIKSFEKKYG